MSITEQIYNEQVDKVYAYFYIKCLNRHVAEDLTSQTFVKFVEQKTDVLDGNLVKYLYGIMRHVWADYLRAKYRQQHHTLQFIEDFEQHVVETIEEFRAADLKARAQQFIDRLPKKQRIVATKRLIEELTIDEVAKELSASKSYVKATQNRAIKSLRKMVAHPLSQEATT